MKLATTTLGCFKWDLLTVLAQVCRYGFEGIDFRGLQGELKLWNLPEFSTGISQTKKRLEDHGLTVTCISSGICLADTRPERMAEFDEELVRSAEICAALDCGQIRVFGGSLNLAGGATEDDRADVVELVAQRVSAMADRAREIAPVDLLIETHDAWTASEDLVAVLKRVNREDVACCWDVKHTYWTGKETPTTSWERLAPWVRNTHWKDVRRVADSVEKYGRDLRSHGLLCLIGEGIVPLADCYELLEMGGYDSWLTLEWEKHWHPHIEEPEIAFPTFVCYMRDLAAHRRYYGG